jgi:hypothetical protein
MPQCDCNMGNAFHVPQEEVVRSWRRAGPRISLRRGRGGGALCRRWGGSWRVERDGVWEVRMLETLGAHEMERAVFGGSG